MMMIVKYNWYHDFFSLVSDISETLDLVQLISTLIS
jgi:hypothetical protein